MYLDFQNVFDNDVAITVTRNSTNVIDLIKTAQDIGTGEDLYVVVAVGTAFTAGGSATLQIALVTDDNASLSSPTVLQDQVAVIAVASLVAGFFLPFRIHPSSVMEQYLGLVYTVATGPMTAGKVTAAIVKDIERWKAYPSGFSVA
jgi:hypothetical protein